MLHGVDALGRLTGLFDRVDERDALALVSAVMAVPSLTMKTGRQLPLAAAWGVLSDMDVISLVSKRDGARGGGRTAGQARAPGNIRV